MTSGTVPLLSPGGMSLITWYHARRVTMSSTLSAQPRRTHGLQGLRVELTERVTKWCLLSADCDVQSSLWFCEDHSRGMAGLCPEDSRTPGRTTELNTLWYSQPVEFGSNVVIGSRILVLKTSLAAALRTDCSLARRRPEIPASTELQ